ncbi:MAG: hypothetical protein II110_05820 [Treponema sp.]|nr:hypothetical protein [Treponema sp.]
MKLLLVIALFDAAFFFLFVFFLVRGLKMPLYRQRRKCLVLSMVFLSSFLLCLELLEQLALKSACLSILIWLCMTVFLILNVVSMKKYLSRAPQIASALFECGEHNALALQISEGYKTYGKSLPPRGAPKPQWQYMSAFGKFCKIDFAETQKNLRSLQSIVRRNRTYTLFIFALGITWILQLPLALLSSLYLIKFVA